MYIELISKTYGWQGNDGVVMDIKAHIYPRDLTTLSEQDALNTRNAGTTIDIYISGLGEVTTSEDALHRNDRNDLTSKWSGVMAVIQQWLVDSNLLQEWGEETSKYIAALSRVDLPCTPEHTNSRYCNYLRYNLKMGEDDGLYITAVVQVTNEHAIISVGLRDGDDKYEDNSSIQLYDSTIIGPVNTDTVKAAVSKVLDRLWDLVNTPLIKD